MKRPNENYTISMIRYDKGTGDEPWFKKCDFIAMPTRLHTDLLQDYLVKHNLVPFEVEEDLNGIKSISPSLIEMSYSPEHYKRINFDMPKDLDCNLIILDDKGNKSTSGDLHEYFESIIYYPCPKSRCGTKN